MKASLNISSTISMTKQILHWNCHFSMMHFTLPCIFLSITCITCNFNHRNCQPECVNGTFWAEKSARISSVVHVPVLCRFFWVAQGLRREIVSPLESVNQFLETFPQPCPSTSLVFFFHNSLGFCFKPCWFSFAIEIKGKILQQLLFMCSWSKEGGKSMSCVALYGILHSRTVVGGKFGGYCCITVTQFFCYLNKFSKKYCFALIYSI